MRGARPTRIREGVAVFPWRWPGDCTADRASAFLGPMTPLQGFLLFAWTVFPGLRPGLSYIAPLGLREAPSPSPEGAGGTTAPGNAQGAGTTQSSKLSKSGIMRCHADGATPVREASLTMVSCSLIVNQTRGIRQEPKYTSCYHARKSTEVPSGGHR